MTEYERPQYVWKLDVEYPETEFWPRGGVPGNDASYEFAEQNDGHFWWPATRRYLSEASAHRRANLLRKYGAKVAVIKSYPITYQPGGDRV